MKPVGEIRLPETARTRKQKRAALKERLAVYQAHADYLTEKFANAPRGTLSRRWTNRRNELKMLKKKISLAREALVQLQPRPQTKSRPRRQLASAAAV